MNPPRFEFRVFAARLFLEVCGGMRYTDAYLAADVETEALQQALSEGFRLYILTAEYAVSERILNDPQD
jgi:hypothetical protein